MRICFFGTYNVEEGYPRVRVLMEGFRRAGHQVLECRIPILSDAAGKIDSVVRTRATWRLARRFITAHLYLAWRFFRLPKPDLVIVGYPGQLDIFPAKLFCLLRGVPVILDTFLSLHDTMVTDRRLIGPESWKSKCLQWLDRWSCLTADTVILDTLTHIRFFSKRFRLPADTFLRVFIGEDDRVFQQSRSTSVRQDHPLQVLYFGSFIPLHGVPHILEAARILQRNPETSDSIRFTIAGTGQLADEIRAQAASEPLSTVQWITRWLPYSELRGLIEQSHVCLGIFGTTPKAGRVIPLKAYASLAMGRALITADTEGARELLRDGETALLVPPGNGSALAEALARLHKDRRLLTRLEDEAARLFREELECELIAGRLLSDLRRRGLLQGSGKDA